MKNGTGMKIIGSFNLITYFSYWTSRQLLMSADYIHNFVQLVNIIPYIYLVDHRLNAWLFAAEQSCKVWFKLQILKVRASLFN